MSHSSGIPVSEGLKQSFGTARQNGNVRFIKVKIDNDEMIEVEKKNTTPGKSWRDDLSYMTSQTLSPTDACYILYSIDTDWVLFCFVPDKCKVKDKMLYASSRSNLKQQLGSNYFSDEIHGTVPEDFSPDGYDAHVHHKKAEAPLTDKEQIRKDEIAKGEIYTGGSSTYVHGVAFPVDGKVIDSIKKLVSGSINYVQVAIDCDAEKVICDHAGSVDIGQLQTKISHQEPRFHFFAYKHTFEGASVTSNVFIYSCPDGSDGTTAAPVRMRMLYSSSKANVSDILTQAGGTVNVKLEVNHQKDISQQLIFDLIHPPKEEEKVKFAKPMKPGKGARKLIRDKN